ncbi:MAG: alpha/beta hydrolase fold domain-containing protein [Oscillospiraceae bacterium]|nr:alpha/beta hydrolase fold domain-containing protein [Oscillospiraceae bacterium]
MKTTWLLRAWTLVLLAASLVCTIMASFQPYSIELHLCLSTAFLAGAVMLETQRRKQRRGWLPTLIRTAVGLSALLTLIMLLGHKLQLYVWIEALNLLNTAALLIVGLQKKAERQVASWILLVLCAAFTLFGAVSHTAYGRSVMSTVAERFLASNKVTDEEVPAVFHALTVAGETSFKADPAVFDKTLREADFDGMPVLYVNDNEKTEHVIFYIHGGYYVYQMGSEQMSTMNRLANTTNSTIVMPIYPLAPFYTTEDNYETMVSLYEQVCRENDGKKIILMGDSAGGGYALALAEGLSAHGIEQPDELILLSPWVDVTMSNPNIPDYYDPMLTITMGRTSGEAWAGSLPMDNWQVSPINGDLSDLKNVTIFVGTRELFYPDDTLLAEKLSANPNVTLVIGKGQNHVYPVYPTLEGRIAVEQIAEIIKR